MTISEALAMYLLQLRADGRSPHTIAQYARHVGLLARWLGNRDLGELTHQDLARFLVSREATHGADGTAKRAVTMNALRSSLRTFFGYLHAAGLTSSNPARLVRRAVCGAPPPRALSDEDQARLLTTLAHATGWQAERDRVLFGLLLATGIRLGSALALDVEDVDLERGELRLRRVKGDRVERAFLGGGIQRQLAAFLAGQASGPLFISRHGGRLCARQAARRLAFWLEGAGVARPLSPHSLRHGFAMALYARTHDVLLVKEALGHRSVVSTLVYVQNPTAVLRTAICGECPADPGS